jgi:hypothetical protein
MKKRFILLVVIGLLSSSNIFPDYGFRLLLSNSLYGQKRRVSDYLKELPKDLKIDNKTSQKYLMTADYYNKDIFGNFQNKTRAIGEYTRGLGDGFVKWNNVYIANSDKLEEAFPEGTKQEYIENMKYVPSEKLLEESFFEKFPTDPNSMFARNLIWDMMCIEELAWKYFDSLELNRDYAAAESNQEIQLAGSGSYYNKDVQISWIGITRMNNEICAIIDYRVFDNLLELDVPGLKSKGSEHYWGKTWVSLNDKQIEYAVMYSSTIQELNITGLPESIIVKTTREVKVEKMN